MRRILAKWLVWIAVLAWPVAAGADDALWTLLQQGGQVVLIRHAQTVPGVGDPPEMARLDRTARAARVMRPRKGSTLPD